MLPSRMFFDDMLNDLEKENKMKCDIFEKDNKVFIEMDVPGYDKKDIKVECNKGNIVVKAEHHEKHEDNKKYLHRERKMYGRLERSFHLEDIDEKTMLIVGDRDIEAGTVSPRHRTDGDLGAMTLDAFAAQLREVVDSKAKK